MAARWIRWRSSAAPPVRRNWRGGCFPPHPQADGAIDLRMTAVPADIVGVRSVTGARPRAAGDRCRHPGLSRPRPDARLYPERAGLVAGRCALHRRRRCLARDRSGRGAAGAGGARPHRAAAPAEESRFSGHRQCRHPRRRRARRDPAEQRHAGAARLDRASGRGGLQRSRYRHRDAAVERRDGLQLSARGRCQSVSG